MGELIALRQVDPVDEARREAIWCRATELLLLGAPLNTDGGEVADELRVNAVRRVAGMSLEELLRLSAFMDREART